MTSCTEQSEEPNTNDEMVTPDPEDEQDTPFSANLVSCESRNIIINVDKGSYDGNFYMGCDTSSALSGTDTEIAEAFINAEINTYGTDLSIVDNLYVFSTGGQINVSNSWMLTSGVEYSIVVFGIDNDGAITTDVIKINATTTSVEKVGSLDFEITYSTTSSIGISVTPGEGVGNYSHCVVPTYTYLYEFGSDADYLAAYALYSIEYYGYSFAEADGLAVLNGAAEFYPSSLWGVTADMSHTVLVYGIDASGNVNTDVVVKECMAGADDVSVEGSVSLELVSSSSTTIVVAAEKVGETGNYYVAPCRSEYVSTYYNDDPATAVDALLFEEVYYYGTDFSSADNFSVFSKSNDSINLGMVWSMASNTPYYVLACGVNENGRRTTDVSYIEVSTASTSAAAAAAPSATRSTLKREFANKSFNDIRIK